MKDRTLLMIPGPIEFEPAVLAAMGAPTTSHIAPDFIEAFGQALERMREVFLCPEGQPFILAGSGTLAMDMAGANLIEPGDRALVVNTGYFGDRYGALLERYGVRRNVSWFWRLSDKLHGMYWLQDPIEYGLLDYNRYLGQ